MTKLARHCSECKKLTTERNLWQCPSGDFVYCDDCSLNYCEDCGTDLREMGTSDGECFECAISRADFAMDAAKYGE